ncbi:MAG: glycosyltransferase [Crocinitomicaceae bacterium]|nr:glycosyltransferase [Crocinitomicaceae bacterium]
MISFFHFFKQKLRLSNPWRYKVPLLIAFCYFLLLAGNVHPKTSAFSFLAAIATTIGFMGFGYLTNDLADRKKDALAGKPNGTANLSAISILLLIITFLAIAILPWLYLPKDIISGYCIVAELLLFVLYAFPPFRLKERGFLGVITDALYAHVVPGFLASWTFYLVGDKTYEDFFYFIIALSVWQLISGIRNIVSHHYKDYENDQSSGTKTFATKIGKEKTYSLLKRVFIPVEVVSFVAFLAFVQFELDFLFVVMIIFLFLAWTNYRNGESDTPAKHFTNAFLDRFYIHWFPYIIIFALLFANFNFWWLIVFHFLIFHPVIGKVTRRVSSKKAGSNESKKPQSYAILSTNRNQYSETFIQAHIKLISNAVVYSDGYFPTSISLDRGKTWNELSKEKDAETALIESWKENNVRAILAEYGPAGAEVKHACRKANIPLLVHFHGFDAYRDDALNHYGESYKELFQLASKIIVVSEDMKSQLLSLGCPSEKIEKITYGIDTDVFSPPKDEVKREHFIACGRFVPKKSPLSTIQAFAKVVESHPEAKLTFIGDGELLDAAIQLSIELNLENNIDFKGVLTQSEVVSEFQKHAIFVQHSVKTDQNDSEGTPLSILEAASTGLAIVSTNHAGIPDVIEYNKSGFLVDEGDVEGMSERMIQLLNDEELRKELGTKARSTVLKNYFQSEYISSIEYCLENAEIPPQKESKLKVWKTRLIIFLVLFLIAEIGLRLVGFKPGIIEDFYYHRGEVEYDSLLYGDEVGITHMVQGAEVIEGGELNSEGFFSSVEFTPESVAAIRKSGKKVVMLIGDSFTQGCCADNYGASFAHILNQSDEYAVLNFGIAGADPVQYRLIVEKYAPILKPDLILVAVYGGNDILEYDRTPKPFVPLSYPIKNGPWLNSEGPIFLTEKGTYFKNFDEAKAHYFEYFSLWSDESSFFEKTIRYSVILSRPYLKLKTKRRFKEIEHQMPESMERMPYSQQNLDSLNSTALSLEIPVVFSLIPSPSDVQTKLNLEKKYDFVFDELSYSFPSGLKAEDYDGLQDGNHFNNQGHQKYADFLATLIEAKLAE